MGSPEDMLRLVEEQLRERRAEAEHERLVKQAAERKHTGRRGEAPPEPAKRRVPRSV